MQTMWKMVGVKWDEVDVMGKQGGVEVSERHWGEVIGRWWQGENFGDFLGGV